MLFLTQKMKAQKNDSYPKFWFGFALGGVVCGLAAMAVGTKQGRTMLKKTVKYMEEIEGEPDQIHKLTDIVHSLTHTVLEGTPQKPAAAPGGKPVETSKTRLSVQQDSTLGSIIDKMRSITSDRKMENRFFKKPTKK